MGHGSCVNGVMCICDPGYEGDFCHSVHSNPSLLKDSFEGISRKISPVLFFKYFTFQCYNCNLTMVYKLFKILCVSNG